jgi:exodeoxyribonuclease VII large subunit
MVNRLERSAFVKLERKKLRLENLQQSLKSLNPIAVLNRGYAIVTRIADTSVVKSVEQVQLAEELRIRVSQGSLDARVTKKIEENKNDQ